MPAPGRYTVDLGKVLSGTLSIWFKNIVPFTLLSVLIYTPVLLGAWWIPQLLEGVGDVDEVFLILIPIILFALLNFLCQSLLTGTLTVAVLASLRGESLSFGACFARGFSTLLPVMFASLLAGILYAVGLMLIFVPGIYAMLALYLVIPVTVMEAPGGGAALRRSWELMRGSKLIVLALVMIFGMVVGTMSVVLLGIYAGVTGGSFMTMDEDPMFQFMQTALSVPLAPLGAIAPALVYFLIRRDKEGQQYEDLARVFD